MYRILQLILVVAVVLGDVTIFICTEFNNQCQPIHPLDIDAYVSDTRHATLVYIKAFNQTNNSTLWVNILNHQAHQPGSVDVLYGIAILTIAVVLVYAFVSSKRYR
jgi:hypothetical protein